MADVAPCTTTPYLLPLIVHPLTRRSAMPPVVMAQSRPKTAARGLSMICAPEIRPCEPV